RTDPRFYPWREEALKRQYLSVAGIPIYKDGNPYCVLGLYAKEPKFFTEETLGLLEELKGDIEFALKRIEEIRNNVIISQALLKSPSAVFILDEEGKIVFCNETVLRGVGRSFDEVVGQSIEMFGFKLSDGSEFYPIFLKFVSQREEKFSDVLFCSMAKNYIEMKIYPIEFAGVDRRFLLIGKDVSEERELITKLERVMLEDPLTGLLNVEGFERRVNKLLGEVVEGCLVFIDIFNFTYINRTYGFEVGNRVLKAIGKLLQGIFPRTKDFIARLGSDEFGCFLKKEDYGDVMGLIDRLGLVKEIRVEVDGQEIVVATNMGISYYPGDGKSVRELLEKASLALSEAKRGGGGEFRFFASHMELKAQEIISLDQLLEKALENRWFLFYYQPYFRVEDLSLAGLEALVRIKVNGKIYNPSEFIDYLEKSRFLPK
uniref:diguanylate cyclase domain-containing protein n=1 Tax=Thermodesulfobacterium hveragerdense TaxID=53424 RepID=UPI00048C1BF9